MDLDQPVCGAIRASQQSLIDLHQDPSQESKDATESFFDPAGGKDPIFLGWIRNTRIEIQGGYFNE